MEYRQFSGSGLTVPALCFGAATFGGEGEFFKAWGNTGVSEAKKLVSLCLEHGVNFFDTANIYSYGKAEEILGTAIKGNRDKVLLATKSTFKMGDNINQIGSSRYSIIRECEDSLRRLDTDYIDLYYMHGFDANTPVEETLRALDDLVQSGKIRYIGCSNFSGWHLMKSLSVSERYGWAKYITYQAYYSLVGREFEWELMPLGIDQKVSTIVWSPLAGGALTGKITRNNPPPAGSRSAQMDFVVSKTSEHLYNIVDVLLQISNEIGKTPAQIALNWVLQRPNITSVIFGARNKEQLVQNFGAVGWKLSAEHMQLLNTVSETKPIYPYWHQRQNPELIKPL